MHCHEKRLRWPESNGCIKRALLTRALFHRLLTSASEDAYRVAQSALARKQAPSAHKASALQRSAVKSACECKECAKTKGVLQCAAVHEHAPEQVPDIVYDVLKSPGQPLARRRASDQVEVADWRRMTTWQPRIRPTGSRNAGDKLASSGRPEGAGGLAPVEGCLTRHGVHGTMKRRLERQRNGETS
jgi:hypothetical protein